MGQLVHSHWGRNESLDAKIQQLPDPVGQTVVISFRVVRRNDIPNESMNYGLRRHGITYSSLPLSSIAQPNAWPGDKWRPHLHALARAGRPSGLPLLIFASSSVFSLIFLSSKKKPSSVDAAPASAKNIRLASSRNVDAATYRMADEGCTADETNEFLCVRVCIVHSDLESK